MTGATARMVSFQFTFRPPKVQTSAARGGDDRTLDPSGSVISGTSAHSATTERDTAAVYGAGIVLFPAANASCTCATRGPRFAVSGSALASPDRPLSSK